jgi:hypothetical protein
VIGFKQVWCMDLVSGLPRIVTFGVSFPFDEILESLRPPMMSVVQDTLHFVLLFSTDKVRWGTEEVWFEGRCFVIG